MVGSVVVGLIVGFMALYGAAALAADTKQPSTGVVVVIFLMAMLMAPIHLILHELGHLAAAILMRLPLTAVAVFAAPRTKTRTIGGVNVRVGLWGRQCHVAVAPSPDEPRIRLRMTIMILAGPGINLLAGVGCYVAAVSVPPGYARAGLLAFGFSGALAGVVNLFPARISATEAGVSDGLLVMRWFAQPEGQRTALMLEHLAWRAKNPQNRWRRFEDLRPPPPATDGDGDGAPYVGPTQRDPYERQGVPCSPDGHR